jgi:hypothetical protein
LEKLFGVLGLTGVVSIALTRLFPWFRCPNTRALNKFACGLRFDLFQFLFGIGIEAMVLADLCAFVGALNFAAREAEPLLLDFVGAEQALLKCPNASFPDRLPQFSIGLPDAQPWSDLPTVAV